MSACYGSFPSLTLVCRGVSWWVFIAEQDQRLRTLSLSESFFDPQIVFPLKAGLSLIFHQTLQHSLFPLSYTGVFQGNVISLLLLFDFETLLKNLVLVTWLSNSCLVLPFSTVMLHKGYPCGILRQFFWRWNSFILSALLALLLSACLIEFKNILVPCTNFTWACTLFLRTSPLILKKVQHVLARW